MNQNMMQFGNQPGSYTQSGNYPGSYAPPGGGPPPPGQNPQPGNYPPPRFPPGAPPQMKGMGPLPGAPPLGGMGFVAPGSQTMPPPPSSGSLPGQQSFPGPLTSQVSTPSMSPAPGLLSGPQMSQGPPPNLGPAGEPIPNLSDSQGSRPPGPLGPPVSQSMLSNGPPVGPPQPPLGNQSHGMGGPPGPPTNNGPPTIGGQQSYANGSPSMMPPPPPSGGLQSPGQLDPSRQYMNGTPQSQLPGGPPLQQQQPPPPQQQMPPPLPGQTQLPPQLPGQQPLQPPPPTQQPQPPQQLPYNYKGTTQMPTPGKPGFPPVSPMNHQPGRMPPPPQQQQPPPPSSQMPYQQQHFPQQQQQQIRTPYPPAPGNYPGGPPMPPNDMRPGYPGMTQGSYQQMNQPYSGLHQNYSGMPSPSYPQASAQHKSQRKLDPDMLPSPIQVMEDDQKNRSGIFYTDQKGLMPPLVTTNFITQDQGNCSPRFLRATTYNVPVTADLLKQTSVPFALLISPLARIGEGEQPLPIINMGELGPVRCNRCKAYMSPFMQFIDGGRRFHCVFCKASTEVPAEYFQHLDHTGQRVDRFERPELVLGAYEYVATKDYCKDNKLTEPPAIIFVIDVSYNNVKSGLVHLLCSRMKEIIRNLPRDEGLEVSNMKVGFITYSSSVHFYNIKSCLAAPQMLLVGDVNDMFMPLLDGFLCDPVESEVVIDLLMQEIPRQFADTRETETILYPAIQAGLEALKASGCAGKLLVFHSSLPIADAPGKLKNRDDRKVLNTDKEKTVLAPQNNSYNNLGQECVKVGCSVDLFIFNNSYVDIATIGEVSRLTGGEIFKYTYFQADIDGERFIADLKRDVSRQTAFDAVMRVRTSTGVRPTDFYGHFYMSNTKDMELASIDSDKAVAVEIKHDDKLTEEDGVYIQVALLYTSCGGQRRLRILNLSLKTCSQMAELYRTCDLDTLVNYFSKQGIFKLLEHSPKQVKTEIMNRCANILACYRKNCANPSSTGQLILPECMKLLPLYVNTLLKSDAFSGGSDMTCDDRSFAMHCVMVMDLTVSVCYFYPRLVALHKLDPDSDEPPVPIRCTYEKLQDEGVYLLDNGIHMFMWLGLNAPTGFISNVFGVPTAPQVDTDKPTLPALENALSLKVRKLVDDIRERRHRSMRLTVLKQRDKMEMVFKQYLMEDHGADGSPSYGDFLCQMHSEIRTILS